LLLSLPTGFLNEKKYLHKTLDRLFDCPYPIVEWFGKYLEYELNPNYFFTPNIFARWRGYYYEKYVSDDAAQIKFVWRTI